jgi:glycosyltransferase involved in cell wall biosynthesis
MRRALASADAIVMNTPESSEQLRRHAPELRSTPIFTIPNGFAAEEFATPAPGSSSDVFRIVHAGNVHTRPESRATVVGRRVLRGAARGFEASARSHLQVLRAIEALVARRPELHGRVRLELVGPISDGDRAALPDGLVHAHGYLSHAETIALLRGADLLFLPMHDLAPGVRARIVPGKTYEYLASGTPILAAVPDGDAKELIERAGGSVVVRPTDVVGMERAIEAALDGAPAGPRRPDVLEPFERRRLTRELAGVFDFVLGGSAALHGTRPAAAGVA